MCVKWLLLCCQGAFSRLDPTGQFEEHLLEVLPTGRLGESEELSNLVSYMVSDYGSWMTGEVILFDSLPYNLMFS